MKSRLGFCLTAALLAGLPMTAGAQVYRCTIDGRVVYQDAPCPGLQGAIKLNPNAAAPPLQDQLRAETQAMRDKRAVANREAAQARQQRLDAALAGITERGNAAISSICASRLAHVQRLERDAAERARQAYTGNRDTRWADLARTAREGYQRDCR